MTLMRTSHRHTHRPNRLLRPAVAVVLTAALSASTIAVPTAQAATDKVNRLTFGIGADETQANIAWQSPTVGAQYLEYWKISAPDDKQRVESERGPHEALMTGLEPDTEYAYRVGNDRIGWTDEYTFTTDSGDDSWNFLAFADAQIGVDAKIKEQAAAWEKAVNTATSEHPDASFIMHLGDQIEGWGAPNVQTKAFTAPEKLHNYRLGVLRGNHETYTTKRQFNDAFYLPNEENDSGNYFFNYNNVLFIGLDSNASKSDEIARHAEFVQKAIDEHGAEADWVIVGFHHAPFSQGTHYTDDDVVRLREELTPKLSDAGVDLVLSGHDHIYTRTHLMEGTEPVIPEGAAKAGDVLIPDENQVLYVTSTTATGGKYYDFQDKDGNTHPRIREEYAADLAHDSTARWRQDYNPDYTSIEVSPEALKLTTYNINTPYVVDQVTLQKKDAEVPEEEEPTTTPEETPEETPTATTSAQPTEPSDAGTATVTTTATATATETTKPEPEAITTTVSSEKTVTSTVTTVEDAVVTSTSTQTSPTMKEVEVTQTVPTTVEKTLTNTSTIEAPTTITKTTATQEPSVDTKQAGSSTAGIIFTVLGVLAALLAVIAGALTYLHPQLVQQIRDYFNI